MNRIQAYGPSLIVLGTTLALLLAGPSAVRRITHAHTEAKILQASQRLEESTILEQINQAYRDIAQMVEPSVVHISTEERFSDRWGNDGRRASSGSGWVYDDDGHVVTNHHVVEGADRIEVQLHSGEIRGATIVGSDDTTDIAVLRIEPGELHPARRRSTSLEPVNQGDMVFAFGSPFDFRFSMSSGVVSGQGRTVGIIGNSRGRVHGYENFIQVDAAINPGNSGGPLTDYRGRVIGMNTAIATGRPRGSEFEEGQFAGIGLAIPIDMIEPVVDQLIETGVVAKGYLGLTVVDNSNRVQEQLAQLRLDLAGLLVNRIPPGHPARQTELRPGDLITAINGERIASIADVERLIGRMENEAGAALHVHRADEAGGPPQELVVRMPPGGGRRLTSLDLLERRDTIGTQLAQLGYSGRGVRVVWLEAGQPAAQAGVRPGDVITEVNGRPVRTVQQLRSRVSSMLPGAPARLTVWRFDHEADEGSILSVEVPLARLNTLRLNGLLPPDQDPGGIPDIGIAAMIDATPEAAESYGTPFSEGVLITEIVRGSRLSRQLPPGSIIVEVMESRVHGVGELITALRDYNLRKEVTVTVITPGGESDRVTLQVE